MPSPSDHAVNDSEIASVAVSAPSFRQTVAAGLGMVKAVPVGPVLLFLVLAPQQTGFCAEILALRSSGRQLPPWLIVAVIIGHASILWLPILIFGFPWIVAGAAARFRDQLIPTARRRSFVEQANVFYGRSLSLLLLTVFALAVLFLTFYVVPLGVRIANEVSAISPSTKPILLALHPSVIAFSIVGWLFASVVAVAWALSFSAVVLDDIGIRQAVGRSVALLRNHPRDVVRFWLFAVLLGVPSVLFHHATFLVPIAPASLVLLAIIAATYAATAVSALIAVAMALSARE